MAVGTTEIVATLILNLIHCSYATDHILSCNVTALEPCPGNNQICNQTSQECVCMEGFTRVGEECVVPGGSGGSGATPATAAVVAVFTLALVVAGLILVVRKYHLLDYVRQKINLRSSHDVMYEDVMIGQDDPPLSP